MAFSDSMACINRSHSSKLTVAPSSILTGSGFHISFIAHAAFICVHMRSYVHNMSRADKEHVAEMTMEYIGIFIYLMR